jgi:hypothetical protein
MMFVIDDELHAEPQGEFASLEKALTELRRRATLSWDQPPNRAPCIDWKTCGRSYELVEQDNSITPWIELRRIPALKISAPGVNWMDEIGSVE